LKAIWHSTKARSLKSWSRGSDGTKIGETVFFFYLCQCMKSIFRIFLKITGLEKLKFTRKLSEYINGIFDKGKTWLGAYLLDKELELLSVSLLYLGMWPWHFVWGSERR
jgi:hypothetical protein